MGIFGRNIDATYGPATAPPLSIASPWSPQDQLVTFAIDDALGALLSEVAPPTRDTALRVPGVKRSHGIACAMFARLPFYVMDGAKRVPDQPRWLVTSDSGVSPYHSKFGMASDWFMYGWACLSFDADMTDAMHVPYGLWKMRDGKVEVDEDKVPAKYRARPIAIPLGYGENGFLVDGVDTLRQARRIEAVYQDRLDNPIPLTILGVPQAVWETWTPEERASYRDQWAEGRRKLGVALKVAEFPVDMPGQTGVDLFESGRNAVRLDIANHAGFPAGLIEGLRQGGTGATEMKYSGVSNAGTSRSEVWDFGVPARMVSAFEARMSLDDVLPSGLSLRADMSSELASPNPTSNPTSED